MAILRRLRVAGTAFTPAAELGEPVSLAARIYLLCEAGYEIEHHPHFGYRLLSSPDRLIADDILSRLPECRWIRDVLVFESTASTNDVVANLARDGAGAGVAAFAEEQTAGRGRHGRKWESDPHQGLWFSILLRPDFPVAKWTRLTLWIAYAVAHGIRQYITDARLGVEPARIKLKWPNDLFLSGRKFAGILAETSLGEKPFAVAGIGLNVNHSTFPAPLDATATSLLMELGVEFDRNALAAAILFSLDQSFSLLPNKFQQIVDWASGVDYLKGRSVSATVGSTIHDGAADGLDAEGALLIRTKRGETVRVASGEVSRFSSETE